MENGFFAEEEFSSLSSNEVEEHVALNPIQQAIKKETEPLKDGVEYDAVLVDIEEKTIGGNPTLSYKYMVNDNYEVEDLYFFSGTSTDISVRRLLNTLKKFGYDLTIESAEYGLTSIVNYTNYLIGSEVKIIQKTRTDSTGSYTNYEIVDVTKKSN